MSLCSLDLLEFQLAFDGVESSVTMISQQCGADDLTIAEEYRTSKGFAAVQPVCKKESCRKLGYKQSPINTFPKCSRFSIFDLIILFTQLQDAP